MDHGFATGPSLQQLVERHLGELLSERELEVSILALSGLSTAAIASRLFVSLNTVKTHIRHILKKTGAANRNDLYRRLMAAEQGQVQPVLQPMAGLVDTDRFAHVRDPLTGLLTQQVFTAAVSTVQHDEDGINTVSVILLHMEGREHLSPAARVKVDMQVTNTLAATVRSIDLVFRWDDSRFMVVLPALGRDEAREVGMRLALCLGRWAQDHSYDLIFSLSSSSSQEGYDSPEDLAKVAQERLNLLSRVV